MTVTDDYLIHQARRAGTDAAVLDLGCGDGRFVETLTDAGIKAVGVDVPDLKPAVEQRLARRPDLRPHIIFLADEERIPLPDQSVDVILSNNVFEHIPTLDSTVREMARILKPGGEAYVVFPLKSAVLEPHALLPFFHRIKSRPARLRYAELMRRLRLYRCPYPPAVIEDYVARHCFYRSPEEVHSIFAKNFSSIGSDVRAYIEVKAKSLSLAGGPKGMLGRILLSGGARVVAPIVHRYHAAAYRLSNR